MRTSRRLKHVRMVEGSSQSHRFLAFLSYRSQDRRLASWLHARLERYRIPRRLVGTPGLHGPVPRRITPIFRDRDDARSAADIETTIRGYLAQSRELVVLCSPAAAATESWVSREIEIFREERPGVGVLAIIGKGEPPDCFPKPLLQRSQRGLLRAPLAADLRPARLGGDGRRRGVIKLIASLAGVEFDALWRRERRRRLIVSSATGLLVLAILGALVGWLRQSEAARLASIHDAASQLSDSTNGALKDLLTIAAGPPIAGAMVSPGVAERGAIEAIARRGMTTYAGPVAMLHWDNGKPIARSHDGRFVVSREARDSRGLFVWDLKLGKLTARLPLSAAHWLAPAAISEHEDKALAVAVSVTGRVVVAAYAVGETERRTLAVWHLTDQGTCDGTCLPETFGFEPGASGPQRLTGPTPGELHLSPDGATAVYAFFGLHPQLIDLASHRTAVLQDTSPGRIPCTVALAPLPEPTAERPPAKPSNAPPAPPVPRSLFEETPSDAYWFDDDSTVFARRPASLREAITFHSFATGEPVASLALPEGSGCDAHCGVEIVFLDQGLRAIVIRSLTEAKGIEESIDLFDLNSCHLDAWPATRFQGFRVNTPATNRVAATLSRSGPYVPSRNGLYLAAKATAESGRDLRRDVAVVIGLQERGPVAIADPLGPASDASSIVAIEAGTTPTSFRALAPTRAAPFGIGSPPVDTSATQSELPGFYYGGPVPMWASNATYAWETRTWLFLPPDALGPTTRLIAAGYKITSAAVSRDARRLALAQSGAIFLQPAASNAISQSIRLVIAGYPVGALQFSANGRWLASAWKTEIGDASPVTVSVWNSLSGALLAQRTLGPGLRMLALDNDGSALVELDKTLRLVSLQDGSSKHIRDGQYWDVARRDHDLVALSSKGDMISLDDSMNATPISIPSMKSHWNSFALPMRGSVGYFSDFGGGYFGNVDTGELRQFLRETRTGPSAFSSDGRFAIETHERSGSSASIEIWDPIGARRLSSLAGKWEKLLTLWFTPDDSELWALDSDGMLHRWNLKAEYAASVASACVVMATSGSRMKLTPGEMAAVPQLAWNDLTPCDRTGPLAFGYYVSLANMLLGR